MAQFDFQRDLSVIHPILSFIGWHGEDSEITPHEELLMQEYLVISGDIGTSNIEEKLSELRVELEKLGHTIHIREDVG